MPAALQNCQRFALHPSDAHQRSEHAAECLARHRRMSSHVASQLIECGICMELVCPHTAPPHTHPQSVVHECSLHPAAQAFSLYLAGVTLRHTSRPTSAPNLCLMECVTIMDRCPHKLWWRGDALGSN